MDIPETGKDRIPVIDVDFHPMPRHFDAEVKKHLPRRWRDYIEVYGLGQGQSAFTGSPPQREFTHRLDAIDSSGRCGVDPLFAKKQVLDEYDLTAAVLTNVSTFVPCGPNRPAELTLALNRAFNDAIAETWLPADPRYYAAVSLARDLPNVADEIRRCKEGPMGDRFVEVMIAPSGAEPLGKERYWPIFEACVEYDIPLACHVPGTGAKGTAIGPTSYYCELHMNLVAHPMTIVPSLIFEGVFDRFPTLKVAFIELGWSWAPMMAWRLDSIHRKLRNEVSHLKRKPSDYMRDHLWYATQPIEEPEQADQVDSVYTMFEETGFGDKLMYSSDYPHWDFDSPYDSVAPHHPIERRRRILGENASKLLKIPLNRNTGVPVSGVPLAAE
jgi:predicted TIM-barrel fold metal-dependent hydrolase